MHDESEAVSEERVFSRMPLASRIAILFGAEPWCLLPTSSDLSLASGRIAGRDVLLLATDPQRAKGTLGLDECIAATEALRKARAAGQPLLLLLDSAGARLDAGLAIQGALRALLRQMLDARLDGLPMLAMLGHHVFGGASLLAFAASERLYAAQTLLAMSGPRLLQGPGSGAVGHAEAVRNIAAPARAGYGGSERLLADDASSWVHALSDWVAGLTLPVDMRQSLQEERALLRKRLGSDASNKDVQLQGSTLSLVSERPLGAAGALALAEMAEQIAREQPGQPLLLLVDCPGHSLALQDEALLQSHYLAHLALSLRQLVRDGTPLRLRVVGEISGGVYVALAGAVSTIELGVGAVVRTLPKTSLAHILKDAPAEQIEPAQYLQQGVVDALG